MTRPIDLAANRALLTLLDRSVEIEYPPSFGPDVSPLFRCAASSAIDAESPRVVLTHTGADGFDLSSPYSKPFRDLDRSEALTCLMEEVVRALVFELRSGVALHAGALTFQDRTILVAGPSGAGKTSLVAWLASHGFDYRSDEVVALNGQGEIEPFFRPLVIKPGAREHLTDFAVLESARAIEAGANLLVVPSRAATSTGASRCGLAIFVDFVADAELAIHPMSAAQCAARLMETNLNARNLDFAGLPQLKALALATPAISLRYGGFDQLADVADRLARVVLEGDWSATTFRKLFSAFGPGRPAEPKPDSQRQPAPIPAPTARRFQDRKLTIGMATYDDYDGVYFTLQALRLYHPEIVNDVEFLVVDNHPDGPSSQALKNLEGSIDNYRYVPFSDWTGGFVKGVVFEQATCPYVLCVDSHVLVVPGGIRRLLDYYADHPDSADLLQGPLVHDDLATVATHFEPEWGSGMFGRWAEASARDDLAGEPFEIGMQGLGLFSCRKSAWPGFNPVFRGFGGEEGYLHEKFRQSGGRALCLPYLGWVHRFGRPNGTPYPNRWEDRIRNYLIGFAELDLPTVEMEKHFKDILGEAGAARHFASAGFELGRSTGATNPAPRLRR